MKKSIYYLSFKMTKLKMLKHYAKKNISKISQFVKNLQKQTEDVLFCGIDASVRYGGQAIGEIGKGMVTIVFG